VIERMEGMAIELVADLDMDVKEACGQLKN
jgi:hypothetical protein